MMGVFTPGNDTSGDTNEFSSVGGGIEDRMISLQIARGSWASRTRRRNNTAKRPQSGRKEKHKEYLKNKQIQSTTKYRMPKGGVDLVSDDKE